MIASTPVSPRRGRYRWRSQVDGAKMAAMVRGCVLVLVGVAALELGGCRSGGGGTDGGSGGASAGGGRAGAGGGSAGAGGNGQAGGGGGAGTGGAAGAAGAGGAAGASAAGGITGSAGAGGAAGTTGAGGATVACTSGPAMDFTSVALPCPSSRTCVADPLGRTWTPPVRIDDGTACMTGGVQVMIAADGSALVAWTDTNPARVRARRLSAGGAWSAAVEDAHAGWGATLRLARAPTGDAMVISTDGRHVRASASVAAAAWTAPVDISGELGVDTAAELAMDKTGAAMAVWMQSPPSYGQATWSRAGGWTTPLVRGTSEYQVTVAAQPAGGFAIAALADGRALYLGSTSTGPFNGYAFGTQTTDVASALKGTIALVVAATGDPCIAEITPAPYPYPANFGADCNDPIRGWQPQTSGENFAQLGTPPHIAVSADGKTVLTAWGRTDGVSPRGYATVVRNSVSVIGPQPFGEVPNPTMNAVAMDGPGNAVVVWGSVGASATTAVTADRFFVATSAWELTNEPLFTSTTPVLLSSLAAASTPTGETLVAYVIRAAGGNDQVYAQILK